MILATSSTSIFCCMVRGVGLFYSQFIKGYFPTNSFCCEPVTYTSYRTVVNEN